MTYQRDQTEFSPNIDVSSTRLEIYIVLCYKPSTNHRTSIALMTRVRTMVYVHLRTLFDESECSYSILHTIRPISGRCFRLLISGGLRNLAQPQKKGSIGLYSNTNVLFYAKFAYFMITCVLCFRPMNQYVGIIILLQ